MGDNEHYENEADPCKRLGEWHVDTLRGLVGNPKNLNAYSYLITTYCFEVPTYKTYLW
jgi:hypothetical protein